MKTSEPLAPAGTVLLTLVVIAEMGGVSVVKHFNELNGADRKLVANTLKQIADELYETDRKT